MCQAAAICPTQVLVFRASDLNLQLEMVTDKGLRFWPDRCSRLYLGWSRCEVGLGLGCTRGERVRTWCHRLLL